MAQPTTREEFIDYCKRALGEPVIEVNVDADQVDDRVDEALEKYRLYHYDGSTRAYFSWQLTQAEITQGYIEFPSTNTFSSIVRVLPLRAGSTTRNFFDFKYQFMLNDFAQMTTLLGDLAYYEQLMQYISTLDMKLSGTPQIDYAYEKNRLFFYGDTNDGDLKAGDYIVIEAYTITDETRFEKVWRNIWLKQYATALIKRQWGQNLIKFEGMQMPGGVTLNGRQIYDDAMNDIQRLDEELRNNYEMPTDFFVG